MPSRLAHACTLLVVASALAACAPAAGSAVSPVAERWPGVSLPTATNALPMDDSPVVVVDGARILVDGEPAGDVAAIVATHRMQRIDPLFLRLKALRTATIAAHPSEPFHGQANLVIDANVTAVVVKSVFQTAAFSGYPFASFVVRRSPSASGAATYGLLPMDAQVPGPLRVPGDERHASTLITPPSLRGGGETIVNGRLPQEVIQRIVRQNFGALRLCYEQGLARDAKLRGKVVTRFVIERDGHVAKAEAVDPAQSVLPLPAATVDPSSGLQRIADPAVEACIVARFSSLVFPAPEGGIVTVVYPIVFNPGE
jgi:hypothetical protein